MLRLTLAAAAAALAVAAVPAVASAKPRKVTIAVSPASAPANSLFTAQLRHPRRGCTVLVRAGGSRGRVVARRAIGTRKQTARVTVGGRPGRRTFELRCGRARAFDGARVVAGDHGHLDPAEITAEPDANVEGAGGPIDLRMPFPCGEQWKASTYAGHGHAVDFNDPAKDDGGRPVLASAAGTAQVPPDSAGGYGKHVKVVHGGGWMTVYAHLRGHAVTNGQAVTRGQLLGYVGTTGNSTGNHLHYEQRHNNVQQPAHSSKGALSAGAIHVSDNCADPPAGPQPGDYAGHIVQWDGDTKGQKTAWLVGPDLKRRWIPTTEIYHCLKAAGHAGPTVLPATMLDRLPDLNGVHATCVTPAPRAIQPLPQPAQPVPPVPQPVQPPTPPTPPAPAPTVSIGKGGSARGSSCSSVSCAFINVNFANFHVGEHSITCRSSHGGEGGWYSYRRSGSANGSAVCFFGYPGRTVWVTVDGVESNRVVW